MKTYENHLFLEKKKKTPKLQLFGQKTNKKTPNIVFLVDSFRSSTLALVFKPSTPGRRAHQGIEAPNESAPEKGLVMVFLFGLIFYFGVPLKDLLVFLTLF